MWRIDTSSISTIGDTSQARAGRLLLKRRGKGDGERGKGTGKPLQEDERPAKTIRVKRTSKGRKRR